MKKLWKEKRGRATVVLLTLNDGVCAWIGMAFVQQSLGYVFPRPILTIAPILFTMAISFLVSLQWYSFTSKRKSEQNVFIPIGLTIVLYFTIVAATGSSRPMTLIVCLLYGILNSLLLKDLKDPGIVKSLKNKAVQMYSHPNDTNDNNSAMKISITCQSRRFTMMIPFVLMAMNHVLFGYGLALSIFDRWVSVLIYGSIYLYYFLWRNTRYYLRHWLLLMEVLVCVGAIMLCFVLNGLIRFPVIATYKESIGLWTQAVYLALFGGGISTVYALLELTQIHGGMNRDNELDDYNDQMRALAYMIGISTGIATFLWILSKMPPAYLITYIFVSCYFVVIAQFRYDKRTAATFKGTISGSIICVLFTSFLLLLGISGVFPYSWWEIGEISINLSKLETVIVTVAGIISSVSNRLRTRGERQEAKEEAPQLYKIRLVGFHTAFLLLWTFILGIICMTSLGTNRMRIAMLFLGAGALSEQGVYQLMRHGAEFFQRSSEQLEK